MCTLQRVTAQHEDVNRILYLQKTIITPQKVTARYALKHNSEHISMSRIHRHCTWHVDLLSLFESADLMFPFHISNVPPNRLSRL